MNRDDDESRRQLGHNAGGHVSSFIGEDGARWPTQCMQEREKTSFLRKSDFQKS